MTLIVEINRITACKLQMVYIQCSRKCVQLLKKVNFEKNANNVKRHMYSFRDHSISSVEFDESTPSNPNKPSEV